VGDSSHEWDDRLQSYKIRTKFNGATRYRGFTNLVVAWRDGEILLDPHATGACVVRLDEDAARDLYGALTEFLG
jgi:hypothetical protein